MPRTSRGQRALRKLSIATGAGTIHRSRQRFTPISTGISGVRRAQFALRTVHRAHLSAAECPVLHMRIADRTLESRRATYFSVAGLRHKNRCASSSVTMGLEIMAGSSAMRPPVQRFDNHLMAYRQWRRPRVLLCRKNGFCQDRLRVSPHTPRMWSCLEKSQAGDERISCLFSFFLFLPFFLCHTVQAPVPALNPRRPGFANGPADLCPEQGPAAAAWSVRHAPWKCMPVYEEVHEEVRAHLVAGRYDAWL